MVVPELNQRHVDFHPLSANYRAIGWGDLNLKPPGYGPRAARLLPAICCLPSIQSSLINQTWRRNWIWAGTSRVSVSRPDLQPLGILIVDPVGLEPTTNRLWAGSSASWASPTGWSQETFYSSSAYTYINSIFFSPNVKSFKIFELFNCWNQ